MINEIDSVISLLDQDIDLLLISLLEQKKSKKTLVAKFEINAYTKKRVIDELENTIHSTCMEELERSDYYLKLKKISDNNCDKCKHSIIKTTRLKYSGDIEYKSHNENRIGCKQCLSRCSLLEEYSESIRKDMFEKMREVITDEIIETKCLISIINKKTKQLKQIK